MEPVGKPFNLTVVLASLPVFPVGWIFLSGDYHIVGQVSNLDDCGNLVLHDFAEILFTTRCLVVGEMGHSLPHRFWEEHA